MKRISYYALFVLMLSVLLTSCADDKGNYDYRELNDIGITFDDDYSVIARERFAITPVVSAKDFDENAYTYEWLAYDNTEAADPVLLGTSFALDRELTLQQGVYTLVYRITEKSTGIYYQKTATLHVDTPTSLGWLLLCSDNGRVQLDMVSHIKSEDNIYHDLLADTELGEWRTPYQLVCDPKMAEPFYLVASSGTTRLSSRDFEWNSSYMLGNEFAGGNYTGEVRSMVSHFPGKMFVDNSGRVYYCNTLMGDGLFSSVRNNGFYVEPQIGYNAIATQIVPSFMMWDKNNRRFVVCANEFSSLGLSNVRDLAMDEMASGGFPVVNDDLFTWPKRTDRMELVHMESTLYDKNRNENGMTYAVLASGTKRLLYGIILGDLFSFADVKYGQAYEKAYYVDLSACPEITEATHFAFSSLKAYMYYAVKNKVYRVNFGGGEAVTDLQFVLPEGEEISLMKFYLWQQTDAENRTYDLIICSKNTTTGQSTLSVYDGFGSEGDFTGASPKEKYEGFADIIDVIYRENVTYVN